MNSQINTAIPLRKTKFYLCNACSKLILVQILILTQYLIIHTFPLYQYSNNDNKFELLQINYL